MSGFGSGSANVNERRYLVECASVNRKGLEIAITLPRPLSTLEPKIREEAQRHISRGRLHISITEEIFSSSKNSLSKINHRAALQGFQELQELQRFLKTRDPITLETVLRLPGVLVNDLPEPIDISKTWKALERACQKAFQSLHAMRLKEGKNLVSDLKKRFLFLEQTTKKIEGRTPHLLAHRKKQLQTRLRDLGVPLAESDPSLLRELLLLAERSNISEEIIRLQSHLDQSREMLLGKDAAGRSLDYLAQEMFREFNTLSHKASDAKIAHWVVQSKSELDKIREQLANFE